MPILEVRPSEMTAMEELAPAAKDALLSHITLKPWLTAHHLEAVTARVEAAVGHRPVIIDITRETYSHLETRRPVHDALDALRDPTAGYRNFIDFIEENENFVPSLQLATLAELPRQIRHAHDLGRGMVFVLNEQMFGASTLIAQQLKEIEDQSSIYFILDYRQQNRELLARAAGAISIVNGIREILPGCFISVSASTFPSTFVGVAEQPIFERRFYDEVVRQIGQQNIIYSDRGSVREERQRGGSGQPAPRIDNAAPQNWYFFREDDNDFDRDVLFQRAAARAIRSPAWDNLGIWGTNQIITTANGGAAIISAQRSTAVRINIHLYRQTNFGIELPPPGSNEDEWTD